MCNGRYSSEMRSCFRKHLISWFFFGASLVCFKTTTNTSSPSSSLFKLFQTDRTVQIWITEDRQMKSLGARRVY